MVEFGWRGLLQALKLQRLTLTLTLTLTVTVTLTLTLALALTLTLALTLALTLGAQAAEEVPRLAAEAGPGRRRQPRGCGQPRRCAEAELEPYEAERDP